MPVKRYVRKHSPQRHKTRNCAGLADLSNSQHSLCFPGPKCMRLWPLWRRGAPFHKLERICSAPQISHGQYLGHLEGQRHPSELFSKFWSHSVVWLTTPWGLALTTHGPTGTSGSEQQPSPPTPFPYWAAKLGQPDQYMPRADRAAQKRDSGGLLYPCLINHNTWP